jgi:tRNA G18 (ribose-2'-O)-methylase SpoU
VAIPTFGVKNSLNVAAAGAVALFEVVRAWGDSSKRGGRDLE